MLVVAEKRRQGHLRHNEYKMDHSQLESFIKFITLVNQASDDDLAFLWVEYY